MAIRNITLTTLNVTVTAFTPQVTSSARIANAVSASGLWVASLTPAPRKRRSWSKSANIRTEDRYYYWGSSTNQVVLKLGFFDLPHVDAFQINDVFFSSPLGCLRGL